MPRADPPVDPVETERERKAAAEAAVTAEQAAIDAAAQTFEVAATVLLSNKEAWKNAKHRAQWEATEVM